jgi:signal transduction histidine kinase
MEARKPRISRKWTDLTNTQLRTKLVLSHLAAALGAIIVLTVIILWAVQNDFHDTQQDLVQARAQYISQQYISFYSSQGNTWNTIAHSLYTVEPALILVTDPSLHIVSSQNPQYLQLSQSEQQTMQTSILQAVNDKANAGYLQDPHHANTFKGFYSCLPLKANGQIIGILFYAEPTIYPQGVSQNTFIFSISKLILITGAFIGLVVILLSFLFARQLTRPIISLQRSVNLFSRGLYSQRVAIASRGDEVGQLAHSFNQMAEQIEKNIQEIQQQDQLRRELTSNIAHDLATPLATIRGFTEALDDDIIQDSQERHDTFQLIMHEIQRLHTLIQNIEQLSSIEVGHIHLDLTAVDLYELVQQTVSIIKPECEASGITLYNMVEPHDIPVLADTDRLIQVLFSLFDNARRYTPASGTITIGCEDTGENTVVWISDTGSGIAPEDLPRIFDRFYRTDPSRTKATGGSGLGLSIVKAIIQAHAGNIYAESTPGSGTRIVFTLPNFSYQEMPSPCISQ